MDFPSIRAVNKKLVPMKLPSAWLKPLFPKAISQPKAPSIPLSNSRLLTYALRPICPPPHIHHRAYGTFQNSLKQLNKERPYEREINFNYINHHFKQIDTLCEAYKVHAWVSKEPPTRPNYRKGVMKIIPVPLLETFKLTMITDSQLRRYGGSHSERSCQISHCLDELENKQIGVVYKGSYHFTPWNTFSIINNFVADNLTQLGLGDLGQFLIALHAKADCITEKESQFQDYTPLGKLAFGNLPENIDSRIDYLSQKFERNLSRIKPIPDDLEPKYKPQIIYCGLGA